MIPGAILVVLCFAMLTWPGFPDAQTRFTFTADVNVAPGDQGVIHQHKWLLLFSSMTNFTDAILPRALNFLILIWQTIKIGELFLPPVDWMLNKMTIEETL